ncbi:MAG: hypothetical protein RI934_1121 [Bacteroidota bacterium]|jgi:hypothetical protein
MNMKNEEQWVNQVLASADQIDQQIPNPFLYQKIKHRIVQQERAASNKKITLKWSVAFILLVGLNTVVLFANANKFKSQHQTKTNIELNNQTVYSY